MSNSNVVRAKITGMGSSVPQNVMTNFDFEKFLDTSDEWITQRTGIKERRIAKEDESTAKFAADAAQKALDDAGVKATDLDLIIVATVSPELPFPSTACFVQDALGATDVPCFDVSAACSGFIYGLTIGSQFIETGKYKKILVVGADCLSKMCDFEDRGSCILFGDAAGGVVLEPTTEDGKGVVHTVMHANGGGWDFIHIPAGGTKQPTTPETVAQGLHFVKMRGRDVYKFAVEKMQWLLGDCMEKANLSVDDIDLVVPHQVNLRIIKSATEKYNFPIDKVYLNLDRFGNSSGASVPLALDEAYRNGLVGPGKTIVMVAFGAGLTWAGAVVKF